MKNVLITGGPTNEAIDEVMKITNMSTGSLSIDLAKTAADKGSEVTLIINKSCVSRDRFSKYGLDKRDNVKVVPVESTQDMYDALKAEANKHYDTVIHASAVGDYRPEFCFILSSMAEELADALYDKKFENRDAMAEAILKLMANPKCKVSNDTKISSYEPHLTVKLTLTIKLIASLRKWFPDAELIGCKLLDNVTREHLAEVAKKLCIKNDMDYIMANDLAELREGHPVRYLINKEGYTGIELNGENGPALLDYAKEHWL